MKTSTSNYILFVFIFLFSQLTYVIAIPVDNGVEGEPTIECGAEAIEITFKTRNPFNGRLYVKGRYGDGDCQNEQIGRSFTGITLSFNTCSVQRLRSLNPKGIFASTTVVISFHPIFVTKVDRVYHVQCFYMESEKSVQQKIQVSEITTAFVTQLVPMPVCRYEILEGGPTGKPVDFAIVGQQVYHKWTCHSETEDIFCMVVHTCMINSLRGDKVEMLDDQGCALDRFVLNNLEYPSDLNAGQEAHVFKYADKSSIFFQCQISITIKEPNSQCPRPVCEEPKRGKREIAYKEQILRNDTTRNFLSLDVMSQKINALDAFLLKSQPTLDLHNKLRDSRIEKSIRSRKFFCWNFSLVIPVLAIYFSLIILFILINFFRYSKVL